MSDRASPIGYIIFAAFASLCAWGYALVTHLPMP